MKVAESMISGIASPRFFCQGHSGYSLDGARRPLEEERMKRWESDPGLRRLVREKKEGVLGRRAFLARLGGATAGAAAASPSRGAAPARAQKQVGVTMSATEPNPATRPARKGRGRAPQQPP